VASPTINDMMIAYSLDAVDFAKDRFGIVLDFSIESVERTEKIAEQLFQARPRGFLAKSLRQGPSEAEVEQICKMLGGYIGEIYRKSKGGDWGIHPEFQAIGINRDDAWIFPPAKVHKRVTPSHVFERTLGRSQVHVINYFLRRPKAA
jgi:hypothetical protein